MIRSFKDAEAERVLGREKSKKFAAIQRVLFRKLRLLQEAATLTDLTNPPDNRLEALKGNRRGQYSIRVNDQWRICFIWREDNAYDVEIVDYH